MNITVMVAVIGALATIMAATITALQAKRARQQREFEFRELSFQKEKERLLEKIEKLDTALDIKSEALNEMRYQRDELKIVSQVQDRFWSQLERRVANGPGGT